MNERIKVSVCVMTCNQESYIGECLESVISQKVDFDIEVIVGVDFSNDNTREIVENYRIKYPNVIKPIYFEHNVGGEVNYRTVHNSAKGELIASMDGDDFWYQGKLASQVKLFDRDKSLVQAWHCVDKVDDKSQVFGVFPSKLARKFNPTFISAEHISLSYALVGQRSSQMFRAEAYDISLLPDGFLDYHIAFLIAINGKSIYVKESYGAYRIVPNNSLTTKVATKNKITVDLLSDDLLRISEKYPYYSKQARAHLHVRKIMSLVKGHDLDRLNENLVKIRQHVPFDLWLFMKSLYYWMLQKI